MTIRLATRQVLLGRPLDPLLDAYTTGLTGAWSSWQRLLSRYKGAARRVRRDTDNAEADFGFKYDNTLDEAAAAAHIGAGSGFDTNLYDQSDQDRGWTQVTSASQPRYITGIGAMQRPAVEFDGAAYYMNGRAGTTLGTYINNDAAYVIAAVLLDVISTNAADSYNNDAVFADNGDAYFGLHLKSSAGMLAYNWGGSDNAASSAVSTGSVAILEHRHEGGNVYARVNGAGETSAVSGNTSGLVGVVTLGRGGGASTSLDGKLLDLFVYDAVPPLAMRNAIVAELIARLM